MANKIISLILILTSQISVYSQTTDSVTTGAYNTNDVFYSLKNGIIKSEPNSNWDIAFEITGYTASILVNHIKGVELYQSPFALAQWDNTDTAGYKDFKKMYNSEYSWSLGAFNRHTDGNYDLGWGKYNPETHIVSGDSIFILKLADGSFKKISIINLFSGVYNFKYASFDGSGAKTISIAKANFKNKNFAYFAFENDSILDREPLTTEWDIVFTKYTAFIPQKYSVAGVWTNKNVKSAEVRYVPKYITNYYNFSFSDTNSVIGYDWKKYNPTLGKYEISDSLVYFIKNANNENWKIYFTGYKGGTEGSYYFFKQSLTASIKKNIKPNLKIYPNPSLDELNIETNEKIISYRVLNLEGKAIIIGNDSKINTSILTKGLYILDVNTSEGSIFVKFIKD